MLTARVLKELKNCQSDKDLEQNGVKIEMIDDSLSKLKGTIKGPPDTPYEGGVFIVDINLPDDYPFKPPNCKFVTKVWHPNVSSQTGAICLGMNI